MPSKYQSCKRIFYDFFFLSRKEDNYFLAFFRMVTGIFCLAHFLAFIADLDILYGPNSVVPRDIMDMFRPQFIPSLNTIADSLKTSNLSQQNIIVLFSVLYIVFCGSLVFGLLTRLSALILSIMHLILVAGSPLFSYGVDYFTSLSLFYCFIFPVSRQISIDKLTCKLRPVNPSPFRKILQLHLTIVYVSSGIHKLIGADWRDGEAIWQALNYYQFDPLLPFSNEFLGDYPLILTLIGWSVVLIELLYPVFVWNSRLKNTGLILICSMHIGISLFMGLHYFSLLMIALNLAAFLPLSGKPFSKITMFRPSAL
jgi:uncharacterized membrane protein YphA (DoxX/SURF4 family)